uniref:histone acetyltransferase n=1 Tax=Asterionellopsis glacialis TaxID=33640 RepID=A0A7S0KXM4_9STRA
MTLEQTPSIEFGEHRARNNDTKLCCKRPRNNIQCEEPPPLRRLVSHEALCCDADYGSVSYSCSDDNGGSMASPRRGSSNQTFSDFDANETLSISKHLESTDESYHESSATVVPHQPNPLHDSDLLAVHTKALHIESELFPLRLILSRLMNHARHNRKGLFNTPVDPILLKLPDYTTVITNPMDLGTIKARLHAAGYSCREDVANDIRLVFQNSMKYNPPGNSVHDAAKTLLSSFEEAFAALPQKGQANTSVPGYTVLSANQTHTQSTKPLSQAFDAKLPAATVSNAPLAKSQMNQFHKTGKNLRGKVKPMHHHFCQSCMGRTCSLCQEGCIPHEASLLICTGSNCNGARIRKGAYYFIAKDGSRQFCQRCYTNLSPVLPHSGDGFVLRYKRDLLKRKNDEEVMEEWVTCSKCFRGAHKICAMHNEFVHDTKDYCCPGCISSGPKKTEHRELSGDSNTDFTFLSGSDLPVKLRAITKNLSLDEHVLRADLLKNDTISSFLERKVRERMALDGCEEASRSVTVRMISGCRKYYKLPEVVRKHFRMGSQREEEYSAVDPPAAVKYNSKAFALFQKIDGLDVFIFCMYVQEYDECEEEFTESEWLHQNKRVNIAYIDSVEHFRPRSCRTSVFHEMLVSYLATARARGYETAHIWACPPSRGNSFVFWNHPASQRTPTRDRLISWYHGAISRAIECGIVSDVKSLYEFAFQNERSKSDKTAQRDGDGRNYGRTICPPLIEGDFWIEEAVRIHTASMARYLKSNETFKKNPGSSFGNKIIDESNEPDFCPALQVASLLRKRVMSHPSSAPFRRPVNTAALKLKDYHIKISRPMDLGTIYSRCVLGEFETLRDLVSDVVLVFSNAMLYNPKGHYVHNMAIEIQRLFFVELDSLAKDWHQAGIAKERTASAGGLSWIIVAELSMSLDLKFKKPSSATKVEEDVTSLQQSKGMGASVSDSSCDGNSCCSLPCTGIQTGQTADDSQAPSLLVSPTQSQCSKDMSFEQKVEEKQCNPQQGLDLLTGGSDAVLKSMVGSDVWLMDKKSSVSPKGRAKKKKNSSVDPSNENSSSGQRRQTWLGDEVAESIRSLRTSFFVCSLSPKEGMTDEEKDKVTEYQAYAASFLEETQLPDQDSSQTRTQGIADARHALLEFSQYRKFEFDTLRRAKYSTAMLLYYIQNADAPGLVPRCSSCTHKIRDVRWHRITKADERSRVARASVGPDLRQSVSSSDNAPEDLCPECYSKAPNGDDFVPLMVSVHG